jgi:peptide deformylase
MKLFSNDPLFPKDAKCISLVHYPDPILKKRSVEVTSFDSELETFCQDLLLTMYHAPGIGLAAAQVAKHLRIFVVDVDYKREKVLKEGEEFYELTQLNPIIFINPKIKSGKGEYIGEEGCLSLPGIYDNVKRKKHIVVDYLNPKGEPQQLEASDLLSACIQHENDHLDGKVFIEKLSSLKFNFYRKKLVKEKSLR